MSQDRITNSLLEEQEITAAKTSLEMSVQRFEMALDNLANRVGTTAHSFQHAKDIAATPKRLFLNAKGTVQDYSNRAVSTVRANPRPFVIGAVGAIGLGVALYFAFRRPAPFYAPVVKQLDHQVAKVVATPFVKSITQRVMALL